MKGRTPKVPLCSVCGRNRGIIRIHSFEGEELVLHYVCVECAAHDRWPTSVRFGRVEEDDIHIVVSRLMDMPFVDLSDVEVRAVPLDLVPKRLVLKHRALPLRIEGRDVVVVFADPFDVAGIHEVQGILAAKGYDTRGVIAKEEDVDALIEKLYGSGA